MLLRKCPACKRYTCKIFCPDCRTKTVKAAPPKYYRKHINLLIQKLEYGSKEHCV